MDVGEIYRLPEGCISNVISLTTPLDSCRSSLVSTTFRSAAESDTVWDNFLPSDYKEILARAVEPVQFLSKKDLYFRLCQSILIDGGKMSFALEKSSGAKCYTLSARELVIIWGDTPRYWKWIPHPDSRFSEVAELVEVCWLEIRGKMDCKILSPKTTYAAYLVFNLNGTAMNSFGGPEQEASVRVGNQASEHTVCLQPGEAEAHRRRAVSHRSTRNRRGIMLPFRRWLPLPPPEVEEEVEEETKGVALAPRVRGHDGWMEVELGEFFNDEGDDGEVDISFLEVKGGHWKSGLIVEGIEVRPKK